MPANLKHIIMSLLLLLSAVAASGECRITHYDDRSGMSQWHVTHILQDRRGFIWFGTWNGLNRFDGYEFVVFKSRPGDRNGMVSDRIRNMTMGDDGNIYCLVNKSVWRFNLTTYCFEQPDAAAVARYRARILADTAVYQRPAVNVMGHEFTKIRQIFTDRQNNTWLMGKYGVYETTPLSQPALSVDAVPADVVRCLFVDSRHRIWVTTRNGGAVTVLDSCANLIGYLGTDGRLHGSPQRFMPVYCMMQQRNGTFWLGSKPHGLFRMRETADGVFTMERLSKGTARQVRGGLTLNDDNVYDIKEDRRGRLWIATHGGGLNMLSNPTAPREAMRFCSPANAFAAYPKGNMLMRRLMVVGDSILLATTTEGFIVARGMDGKPSAMTFNLHTREPWRKESLSCSAVMDMLVDRKGRLFISSESGGVNMLLTRNLSDKVFSFRHFNTADGMGSDVALAMTEVQDEILVQCNNQVVRINADRNEIENFNDIFFSMAARFSDAEPVMLPDGRWLLTLETGLLSMHERFFHRKPYIPGIVLTSFLVPGRPVDYSADIHDTIRLAPSERNITLHYAALDFKDNSRIKYTTRMIQQRMYRDGADTLGWTIPQTTRSVSFFDLSPGVYRLEIRSTNAEGLWTGNVRAVTIVVEPTFWETPLAYLLYLLLVVAVVSGVTYTIFYIRTLKRQREENLQAYLKLFESRAVVKTPQPAPVQETEKVAETPAPPVPLIPSITEEDETFMRRLLAFVDANLGNSSVGIDDMAAATATSSSSLNRKTKRLLGVTPADFLREARMKRASQLLLTTHRGVNDIAYSCGFTDPKYFSRIFKMSNGMTPSEYRAGGGQRP